jgi:hypothetical protein
MEKHPTEEKPLTHDLTHGISGGAAELTHGIGGGAAELTHDLKGTLSFNKEEPKEEEKEEKKEKEELTSIKKWKYTLMTTIIFLIIANPYTYILVNSLLGKFVKIASSTGCPTTAGLLIHAVVFTLLLRGVMELKV